MSTPTQQPSVGRIVHYVSRGSADGYYDKRCRAAVVTEVEGHAIDPTTGDEVDEWCVGLCVLTPAGSFFNNHIVQDNAAEPGGGTWHWPEQV